MSIMCSVSYQPENQSASKTSSAAITDTTSNTNPQQQQQTPQQQSEELSSSSSPSLENSNRSDHHHHHETTSAMSDSTTTTTTTTLKDDDDTNTTTNSSSTTPATVKQTTPTTTTTSSSHVLYNPNRVITKEQLEVLNLLVHPVWIFDIDEKCMKWANSAAVEWWNADSITSLLERNFKDMSVATCTRLLEYQHQFNQGQYIKDHWTLYPKGQAKLLHVQASGIRTSSNERNPSMLVEGIPLVKEEVNKELLRGVEMVRHLPMAICQFDIHGNCMFQNPEAIIRKSNTNTTCTTNTTNTTTSTTTATKTSTTNATKTTMETKKEPEDEPTEETSSLSITEEEDDDDDDDDSQDDDDTDDDHDTVDEKDKKERVDPIQTVVTSSTDVTTHCTTTTKDNDNDNDNDNDKETSTNKENDYSNKSEKKKIDQQQSCTVNPSNDTAKNDSKTITGTTTTTNTTTTNNNHAKGDDTLSSSSSHDGGIADFIGRFVDATVGTELLHQIQTDLRQKDQTVDTTTTTTTTSQTTNKLKDSWSLQAQVHTPKGPKWCCIQIRKSVDPVTAETVLLYSARDLTDALEAKRERQARIQKSEFLAIMAHEIRTPLHQVTGFIDLLDQTTLNGEQKSFVKLLKQSAHGLMTVISDVLDYSKLEAGKMKLETIPFQPLSVMEGSMEAVRATLEEKGLYIKLHWSKDIPYKVMGDPNRLRQVLLNLLSNAVKFTKRGGIQIQVSMIQQSQSQSQSVKHENNKQSQNGQQSQSQDGQKNNNIPVSDKQQQQPQQQQQQQQEPNQQQQPPPMFLKFVVQDTGMGITEHDQEQIFLKYSQANASVARHYGGTGLGLSICQLLVQTMGGSIGVTSQIGKGASFWFTLPAYIPSEQDVTEPPEDDSMVHDQGRGLNILIAEDNKINQKLLVNMLKRMGHSSTVVENGKLALEEILSRDAQLQQQRQQQQTTNQQEHHHLHHQHHHPHAPFDVVLMDIQMPVMDGLEATRRLRSLGYTDLPIYGLTASVARSDYVELGFNDWIPKPIPMKDLKAKLYRLKQCQSLLWDPQ